MPKRNYNVGYGKPPKDSQFQPGQSGNPKGRRKGAKGLKTDLKAQLTAKVSVTENGERKKLRVQELILKTLAAKAAKGDVRAIELIVSMTIQMFGLEDERNGKSVLSQSDQAILDDYLKSQGAVMPPPPSGPSGGSKDTHPEPTARQNDHSTTQKTNLETDNGDND